jgi:hypothetical protein
MSKDQQIEIATRVVNALQEALGTVVEEAIRRGDELTDRALLTGIATVFMEGMALTVTPDKWEMYIGSLLSPTTIEQLTKLRESSIRGLDRAKAELGIDNDEDMFELVKNRVAGRSGTTGSGPLN